MSLNTLKQPAGVVVSDRLTDANFAAWAVRVKFHLKALHAWAVVENGLSKDAKPEEKALDELALGVIVTSVDNKYLAPLDKCKTAKDAWELLMGVFGARGYMRKMQLLKELFDMSKGHKEAVGAFIMRVEGHVDQLAELGFTVEPALHVALLLNGLPKDYDTVVSQLSSGEKEPSLAVVKAGLMNFDQRIMAQEKKESEAFALAAMHRKPLECWNCGQTGHKQVDCKQLRKLKKDTAVVSYAL